MKHLLNRTDIEQLPEHRHQHQFNPNAVRMTRTLSGPSGLSRLGLHLVRLEPGRDSTQHHYHDNDEEFMYVLAGRGIASIGDESVEVGAGDFMGFPGGSEAHSMHNPFDEDLVYLMGGERNANDVVHYPDIRRSMAKSGGRRIWWNWSEQHET